jgi:hypothetical protein
VRCTRMMLQSVMVSIELSDAAPFFTGSTPAGVAPTMGGVTRHNIATVTSDPSQFFGFLAQCSLFLETRIDAMRPADEVCTLVHMHLLGCRASVPRPARMHARRLSKKRLTCTRWRLPAVDI